MIYDINTFLYGLTTHGSDAAGGLELYGSVDSWPTSLSWDERVDHFNRGTGSYLSVGAKTTFTFTVNTTTNISEESDISVELTDSTKCTFES